MSKKKVHWHKDLVTSYRTPKKGYVKNDSIKSKQIPKQNKDYTGGSDSSSDEECIPPPAKVKKRKVLEEPDKSAGGSCDNTQATPKKFKSSAQANKSHSNGSKKEDAAKCSSDEVSLLLGEEENEIERELEMKAKRNNLTALNVKSMIKAVLSDSEVLKLVDYSLQKTQEKPVYELKFTRAKAKELEGFNQNVIFNPPSASKNPEIEALISQELPEDSSDEEYDPEREVSDDEESKASEAFEEDLETSVRSCDEASGAVGGTGTEAIGLRTRSKLSLSSTPLETIEQAFVPPDITTDMYNTDCDNEDWVDFLKEFMRPLSPGQEAEVNDDDNDPEYNVMNDESEETTDREELRADWAVKVTKRELNDLMSELFEYTDMLSSEDEEDDKSGQSDKENDRPVAVAEVRTGGEEALADCPRQEEPPPEPQLCQFHPVQMVLLKQQLRQHVQLLAQTYLLSYGLPQLYDQFSQETKARLYELSHLRSQALNSSFYNIKNLDSCISLVERWTQTVNSSQKLCHFIYEETMKIEKKKKFKVLYKPKLPEELIKLCLSSEALIYPALLPTHGFLTFNPQKKAQFLAIEEQLLATGMKVFSEGLELEPARDLREILAHISYHLMPIYSEAQLVGFVKHLKQRKDTNPVKEFLKNGTVQSVHHQFVPDVARIQLSKIPPKFLPELWRGHLPHTPLDNDKSENNNKHS